MEEYIFEFGIILNQLPQRDQTIVFGSEITLRADLNLLVFVAKLVNPFQIKRMRKPLSPLAPSAHQSSRTRSLQPGWEAPTAERRTARRPFRWKGPWFRPDSSSCWSSWASSRWESRWTTWQELSSSNSSSVSSERWDVHSLLSLLTELEKARLLGFLTWPETTSDTLPRMLLIKGVDGKMFSSKKEKK